MKKKKKRKKKNKMKKNINQIKKGNLTNINNKLKKFI
jgi:hypothetical protein